MATESKKNIIVSNVAKIDADHAIPLETKGLSFIAEQSLKYIPFLGTEDIFFETLAETRMLSPTQSACIGTKVKYSVGSGWTFNDEKIDKEFHDIFAKCVSKKGHTLNDILRLGFDNGYTSGNCFIDVARAQLGKAKSVRLFVKNNFDSRLAYSSDPDMNENAIFSSRFRKETGFSSLPSDQVSYPLYSGGLNKQSWISDKIGTEHLIFHLKNEVAGLDSYGLPSNVGGYLQAVQEYKSARFNIDNFENNMVIGGVLLLKSSMTEQEIAKHARKIVKTHTGDGKTGRIMIMATEEGFEDSKFIPFDTNKEGSFIELGKRVEEQIIIANDWDQVLAGINTGSSLGRGKGYFKEIYEIKYKSVIRPEQEKMIEKFLRPLIGIINELYGTKFPTELIDIKTEMPVSFGSEIDPNKVMTVTEGRTYFPALKEDGVSKEVGAQLIDNSKNTINVSGSTAQ